MFRGGDVAGKPQHILQDNDIYKGYRLWQSTFKRKGGSVR